MTDEIVLKDRFTCPNCGSRSMIRVENKELGNYILRCEECKTELGPLPLTGIKRSANYKR